MFQEFRIQEFMCFHLGVCFKNSGVLWDSCVLRVLEISEGDCVVCLSEKWTFGEK